MPEQSKDFRPPSLIQPKPLRSLIERNPPPPLIKNKLVSYDIIHPDKTELRELDRLNLAANQRIIDAAKNSKKERREQADLESDRARQAAEVRRRGEKIKDYNKPK